MNPNYDMTKLRNGLDAAWKRLAELGEHKLGNEVEEALHILATQAAWIAKARPVLYHLGVFVENSDEADQGSYTSEAVKEQARLLDGWLPPSNRQVSFDGQNWIDLPYNKSVPDGMQQRVKMKGGE